MYARRHFDGCLWWAVTCASMVQFVAGVSWQASMQALIDNVSDTTGYAIGLGLVDDMGHEFGIGAGTRTPSGLPSENLTGLDTYVLGSGAKPFVATCIMRLVEQGKVSLDDRASTHIDKSMMKIWNTSFVELFGPMAANVTVGNLIRMQSGLGEFETPTYDDSMLNSSMHDPLLDLKELANKTGPFGCQDFSCTWVCAPGSCTSYASANYVLAGVVLLAHAIKGQSSSSWKSFNLFPFLGPDFRKADFGYTHFPTFGPLPLQGLTTTGRSSRSFGVVEVYSQDASILGWCYGNAVASPRDVAKFFFDLLGPSRKFVNQSSLAAMQEWSVFTTGWAAYNMNYGAGLEVRNVARYHALPPRLTDLGTFIGHDGETFGFWSNQGWFPNLNTSITVFTNQDHDANVNYALTCSIVKLVAQLRNISLGTQFQCATPMSARSQASMVPTMV